MSKSLAALWAVPGALLLAAGTAFATPIDTQPTAIFVSGGVGGPLSTLSGLTFNSFDRPVKSPDGSYWMMLARNTGASTQDAMYITGQARVGTLQVHEGTTVIDAGRTPENMSDRVVGINNSGQWAVGIDLNGSTADDRLVVVGSQTPGLSIVAREGQINSATGLAYTTTTNGSVRIQENGQAAFSFTVNSSSTTDQAFFTDNGATLRAREGTHFTSASTGGFSVNGDGSQWAHQANIIGATSTTDNAFFVNNSVVLREGFEVAASMPAVTYGTIQTISLPYMDGSGDWFARGRNSTGDGWAVRNGAVLAKGGDLVGGAYAGEKWDETLWNAAGSNNVTFFQLCGDSNGNFVVGGFTDNADTSVAGVWMYNGVTEILRLGDQVDVDGDGALDDAFIYNASFAASPTALGGFLSDDGFFYTNVDLRNGAGDALGTAFLRLAVPAPGTMAGFGLAGLLAARRRR